MTLATFPNESKYMQEYAKLIKTKGKGESACLAYCKFKRNVLASSNIRDMQDYCQENQIEYLTTMDFG